MGWLGLDDTDTLSEGCTTFSLHLLISKLPEHVDVGEVRLVRLWPFARQRTRGNAAVAVELTTENEHDLLRFLESYWNNELQALAGAVVLDEHNQREQSPADPGMVWFSESPPPSNFYQKAVSSEVKMKDVPKADASWGGMGIIGATAAVLWPQNDVTWEAIGWREQHRWPSVERRVCESALAEVASIDGTFLTRDPRTQRSLISPRGTCPVLFGVRGRTIQAAQQAASMLVEAKSTERVLAWRVFATNQATDDHLGMTHTGQVEQVEVLGRGTSVITTEHGRWMAFAESGNVKRMAQTLQPGDVIEALGLAPEPGVLHIEKMRVKYRVTQKKRPLCEACQRTMKSMGSGQGVRCPVCKQRQSIGWVELQPHLDLGWVQPPPDARRHLAKPLEWYLNKTPSDTHNG